MQLLVPKIDVQKMMQKKNDARDIFFKNYSSLIKLALEVHIARRNLNVLNWFYDVHKSVLTSCFQTIIIQLAP